MGGDEGPCGRERYRRSRVRWGRPGRPRTLEYIRRLILKLAFETGWGNTRILGEFNTLGIHVSRSTGGDSGQHPRGPDRWSGAADRTERVAVEELPTSHGAPPTANTPPGFSLVRREVEANTGAPARFGGDRQSFARRLDALPDAREHVLLPLWYHDEATHREGRPHDRVRKRPIHNDLGPSCPLPLPRIDRFP